MRLMLALSKKGKELAEAARGKLVILVIGPTGSGKSTLINY